MTARHPGASSVPTLRFQCPCGETAEPPAEDCRLVLDAGVVYLTAFCIDLWFMVRAPLTVDNLGMVLTTPVPVPPDVRDFYRARVAARW